MKLMNLLLKLTDNMDITIIDDGKEVFNGRVKDFRATGENDDALIYKLCDRDVKEITHENEVMVITLE